MASEPDLGIFPARPSLYAMKHSTYQSDASALDAEQLHQLFQRGYPKKEAERIARALDLAIDAAAKDTETRPRGIDVAHILLNLKVDADSLQAALLSDPYLRETLPPDFIRSEFGETVASLSEKVNWLNTFSERPLRQTREPEQAELLRRMLLAVVNDARAVLIRLAYRVQRLRILKYQDNSIRESIARETLELYAPLANRLGVGQLKWELEDLAFRYLHPEEYKSLAKSLAVNRAEREDYVYRFLHELREELAKQNITARVYGRPKHLYSIWKKMQRKHAQLEDLYDLHAVRVIVDTVPLCYTVLGIVHSRWPHIPKEFDDYIANPKSNGYQSLHTVVVGPESRPVEIQIRTQAMHEFAEYGVAAHWRYKEGGGQDAAFDRSIASLRRLLESEEDDDSLLQDFRGQLFGDDVFVLTPRGQVIRLVKGSTPIDFAYAIHTEVGHRCRGAKVNGRMVPLTYQLKSGDKVEILTTKHGGPTLGWLDPHLGYIRTAHARNKIRQWFKQQNHEKHLRAGKAILDRERHKLNLRDVDLEGLARHFHLPRADDLLLAIGRGDIGPVQLAGALQVPEFQPKAETAPRPPAPAPEAGEVTVLGIRNLLTHFAQCCTPVPGDPIIGYITVGHGVAIHRQDCQNILQLPLWKQNRLIDVAWGAEAKVFPVEIEVRAFDRKGLLKDVTQVLANDRINIVRTYTNTNPDDRSAIMELTLEVQDLGQLSTALEKISQIHNVQEARRKRR